jgi:plasmid stabilization system protein ParE
VAAVKWTEPARDDLAQIHDFIARDSPGAARALVERVLNATEQLASFRVVYRIEGKTIWIAVVIHGRRLLTELP